MSAKNKQYKKQPIKQVPKANAPRQPAAIKQDNASAGYLKWVLILCVAIATIYTYRYTIHNEFTNWDDGLYVEANPYIKNLTPENIKMILFHNITNNYYHPITMMTFALNYHFSKMNCEPYYITNITVHVFNVILIFLLVLEILQAMSLLGYGKVKGAVWFAALCALWHGIHPMHVESVSWMAERKDVMYIFFYLLGLIAYVRYAVEGKMKLLAYTALFYMLSILSKPMAVTFPLSIFAFDVLLKRDQGTDEITPILKPFYIITLYVINLFSKIWPKRIVSTTVAAKLIAEKVPLFIISVLAGILAFITSAASGCIGSFQTFSIGQRLMFASNNFLMYFAKAFVPVHLCSYYPYPVTSPEGYLPIIFYLSPLLAILLPVVPLYIAYRAGEKYFRVALFGFLYYFFNVIFILQIVSAGPAIMADRYSDAPYFGIVFLVVYFLFVLIEKKPASKAVVIILVAVASVTMGYLSYDRTKIWHNTETLWKDVIAKYPYRVPTSYKNLGNYYAERGQYDSAFYNYKILADGVDTNDAGVYSNIGNIYGLRKDFPKSLAAYSKALKHDSSNFDSYLDRAITYSIMQDYPHAFKDYDKAYKMDPNSEKLLENRGYTYMADKQYDKSIADYTRLIQINPDKPATYFNRGIAEFNKGDNTTSLNDFLKTIQGDPQNKDCLYDIALTYERLKDYPNALTYTLKAKQAGFAVQDEYIAKLKSSTH